MKKIETPDAPKAIGPYSQAIVITENQALVFVSGQLPIDPRTGELVQGDIRVMTKQVLDNIESILVAGSSSLYRMIRVEIFLTHLQRDFSAVNEEYGKRINQLMPPSRQTIEVSGLPKGSPIEISCIALVVRD